MSPLTKTSARITPVGAPVRTMTHRITRTPSAPVIRGLGVAVPEHSIRQHEAAEIAADLIASEERSKRAIATLYRRSGVASRHCAILEAPVDGPPATQDFFRPRTSPADGGPSTGRRMALYEQSATRLAVAAARRALAESDLAVDRITHIVTATCTGFSAPGFDLGLIEQLPLPRGVQRTQVGFMGCHAALNALRVAQAYCKADPRANVLVCVTEICSLHFQYNEQPQTIVSNALFADGAAAAVVSSDHSERSSCVNGDAWRLGDHASFVVPNSADLMSWRIGDHGFEMTLSPRLPDLIAERLAPWVDAWLARQGLARQEVRSWAIHPGGRRILAAAAESLALTSEQMAPSEQILRDFGNMSSPTVLFILRELQRRRAGLPAVMLAFGPGVTIEAALVR
ncbi:type III polyketide synthase [Lacipirellula parvula]|uniref:Naringenin-chalcone synthase n=1 Tax=Lacipirellula parvula TaxID=2650471 RepID=A0A5K7XJB3_9BACT|nr:type III polyketide synthase [Lacipirellula parvula]BBO34313.1 naringenin-chalcone synthase [Lacipirellula parvula]